MDSIYIFTPGIFIQCYIVLQILILYHENTKPEIVLRIQQHVTLASILVKLLISLCEDSSYHCIVYLVYNLHGLFIF